MKFVITLTLLILTLAPAEARRFHYQSTAVSADCNVLWPCEGVTKSVRGERAVRAMGGFGTAVSRYSRRSDNGAVTGGRPAGCPYAFCGCGASLYLFGRIIPELNLAANWLRKFSRTSPAPRMAAARPGHVMVLVEHRQGNIWLVHDSNSGGHQTRLHERSIAGYTIVNPHS